MNAETFCQTAQYNGDATAKAVANFQQSATDDTGHAAHMRHAVDMLLNGNTHENVADAAHSLLSAHNDGLQDFGAAAVLRAACGDKAFDSLVESHRENWKYQVGDFGAFDAGMMFADWFCSNE